MRVAVALEPDSAEAARIIADWLGAWSVGDTDDGVELAVGDAVAALLELKSRCYDRGLTVNALFPDNQ